jgi:hypothetical protein
MVPRDRAAAQERLAVVELVALAYGPAALLGPSPAGPPACLRSCPWCASRWPSDLVWWGWSA